MKTAIVYDRVNKWGGAEQVLLALREIYPKAPLYTSVYNKDTAEWAEVFSDVRTTFLQKVPFARKNHEFFAPFMPTAFETFEFDDYDLVISVTSEAAKGVITKPGTLHVCYCLTPTRYLWSGYDEYFDNGILKMLSKPMINYLREWDTIAAQRPDHMIAISTAVQERIKKYYARESEIIYPPVDVSKYKTQSLKSTSSSNKKDPQAIFENEIKEEYYLIVSRLVSYKKVDLAVETFNELNKRLVVVGIGKQMDKLRSIANENIEIKGFVTEEELMQLYKNAKAFIFPQEEDFGITALESQSAGVPVIAYKKGGALDTVEENMTGVFFDMQNIESLKNAVKKFEKLEFSRDYISKRSEMFSKENFKHDIKTYLDSLLKK